MTDTAYRVIVIIMLCISNFQTFFIIGALAVVAKNTEWGRGIITDLHNGGEQNG